MSAANNGGPAFPVQDVSKWQAHGMTLRDYFAAKAMQSLVSAHMTVNQADVVSKLAYGIADAMLKQREVA